MKFIADAMLGRLARWLRLMGLDTLYYADIRDSELLMLAKGQERIILTRDTGILKRGIEGCVLIESEDPFEQLEQVFRQLRPGTPREMRCANCNGALEAVPKEDVADSVPEYVYLNHSRFLRCTGCGNIYWEGSQYLNIKSRMDEILKGREAARRADGP
jgi:uncharacterized protein with PIN domain